MSLPEWLEPMPDAGQMRAIDAWAIDDRGVPSLDLMERAGLGVARLAAELAPDGRVTVVCGKGNNGGDGLVAARHLRDEGRTVDVLCVADPSEFGGDAQANLERLPGEPPAAFGAAALDGAELIVDGLLGTGFDGAPRDPVAGAIEAINAASARVVAVDVPSGVDASTGTVAGAAVRAVATATFHAAKPGLWIGPGKRYAGDVRVIDIGIPAGAPVDANAGLMLDSTLGLIPARDAESTKFSEGALLVAGGSVGLTGAPCLVAEAAQRAGAGYVTACVPASLNVVFELRLLEAMTRPLPDEEGSLVVAAAEHVLAACERADALVLGPGLGRGDGAVACAREVAGRAAIPLLLDADGLNAHAERLAALSQRVAPTVLTPHAGELARLLGTDSPTVQAKRLEHARAAAQTSGATVVLKGDDTLVVDPDGRVGVSRGGVPALATAGTGDVLSGVIGALLAKGLAPFEASCAGVWLHAEAGRRATNARSPGGVIARDVIEALPLALSGSKPASN